MYIMDHGIRTQNECQNCSGKMLNCQKEELCSMCFNCRERKRITHQWLLVSSSPVNYQLLEMFQQLMTAEHLYSSIADPEGYRQQTS